MRESDHLVAAIGNCCPRDSETDLNDLNLNIMEGVQRIVEEKRSIARGKVGVLLLGGNGGAGTIDGGRGTGEGLREAERMRLFAEEHIPDVYLMTDCDIAFREYIGFQPSTNTETNIRNLEGVIWSYENLKHATVVAHYKHMPRVIGVCRKQLTALMERRDNQIDFHATGGSFEWNNDQLHTRHDALWAVREPLVRLHHIATGKVPRKEFLREWMSGFVGYDKLASENGLGIGKTR